MTTNEINHSILANNDIVNNMHTAFAPRLKK